MIGSPVQILFANVKVEVGPTTETEPVAGVSTRTSTESKPVVAPAPVSATITVPLGPGIEKLTVRTVVPPELSTSWPVTGGSVDADLSSRSS